jgi:hypothetical protein
VQRADAGAPEEDTDETAQAYAIQREAEGDDKEQDEE